MGVHCAVPFAQDCVGFHVRDNPSDAPRCSVGQYREGYHTTTDTAEEQWCETGRDSNGTGGTRTKRNRQRVKQGEKASLKLPRPVPLGPVPFLAGRDEQSRPVSHHGRGVRHKVLRVANVNSTARPCPSLPALPCPFWAKPAPSCPARVAYLTPPPKLKKLSVKKQLQPVFFFCMHSDKHQINARSI